MGNVLHLQNLGQGAGRWNSWREQEPSVQPDLSGADLRGADLSGMDLSGAVLALASMPKANLCGAVLRDANLAGANLDGALLCGAVLERANLAGAILTDANLSGAWAARANLAGANLGGNADLSGADLTGANMAGTKLQGAMLSGCNLTQGMLAGADFTNADLSGANLTDAVTSGARFEGANMVGVDLRTDRPRKPEATAGRADNVTPFPGIAADPRLNAEPTAQEERGGAADDSLVRCPEQEEPVAIPQEPTPISDDFAFEAEQLVAEQDIEDEISFAAPQNVPLPEPRTSGVDEIDDRILSYQTKEMAILALCSSQFGRKSPAEKKMFIDLLVQYNRNFFRNGAKIPLVAAGSVVLAGFDDPTDALHCANMYISMLKNMHIDAYAGVNLGTATVAVEDGGESHDEIVLNSIPPMARLIPLHAQGEVLILEELYSHAMTRKDEFAFEQVTRRWGALSDSNGEGVDVVCYTVIPKRD
jgi:uncharacterized protein YjbI with pentapeptide repeats